MGTERDKEIFMESGPPEKNFEPSTSFLEMLNCL